MLLVEQEIRLADDSTIIACGLAQLSWNIFRRSIIVRQSGPGSPQTHWSLSKTIAYTERLSDIEQLCRCSISLCTVGGNVPKKAYSLTRGTGYMHC
jgi:hypothetical protein